MATNVLANREGYLIILCQVCKIILTRKVVMVMWKDYEYGGLQYRVSDSGEVFGCGRNRALKTRLNEDGYTSVTIGSGDERTR